MKGIQELDSSEVKNSYNPFQDQGFIGPIDQNRANGFPQTAI